MPTQTSHSSAPSSYSSSSLETVSEQNLSAKKLCLGDTFIRKSCPTRQDMLSAPGTDVSL